MGVSGQTPRISLRTQLQPPFSHHPIHQTSLRHHRHPPRIHQHLSHAPHPSHHSLPSPSRPTSIHRPFLSPLLAVTATPPASTGTSTHPSSGAAASVGDASNADMAHIADPPPPRDSSSLRHEEWQSITSIIAIASHGGSLHAHATCPMPALIAPPHPPALFTRSPSSSHNPTP